MTARDTVRIGAPTAADEAAFLAAVAASRALHHPWVAPPADAATFRAWLDRVGGERHASWLLRTADDELVGVINANEIVRGAFHSTYLGYYGFAGAAGKGLMRAGFALVLDEVFGTLGLHRVEANIQPANERSIGLVRSLGFRREGFSPAYLFIDGAWRDHERWALLVDEWRGRDA